MKSLLEHVHGIFNKYNCFINILGIVSINKEKDEGTLSLEKINSIEFKNVKLSYDGVNTILDKINLKIDKPMTVAIVGKSGAGKTSLVNLIPIAPIGAVIKTLKIAIACIISPPATPICIGMAALADCTVAFGK